MTLGNFIKKFRLENEMTQREFAEELGIPGSNADICRIEKGTERTLNMLRARFIFYTTMGKNFGKRKYNAKLMLITVDDLRECERECLVSIILE